AEAAAEGGGHGEAGPGSRDPGTGKIKGKSVAPSGACVATKSMPTRVPPSQKHNIELLLQILLVCLEADALAEEFLQLDHRRRFVLGDAGHDLGRGDHQQALGLELAHGAHDLAEDLV